MENDRFEPKNTLFEEVSSKGYRARAKIRATRRKSPWNLILVPLVLAGTGIFFYAFSRLMWWVHTLAYQPHAGHFREFMLGDMEALTLLSFMLLFFPLFMAALPPGMLVANSIAWCIPPLRKIFEQESRGHKFTSFSEAMSGLFKACVVLVPVCMILSLIGALTLKP